MVMNRERRKEMRVMTLVCDMCPPTHKAAITVTFALDGKAYEELCTRHLKNSSRVIEHYACGASKLSHGR
jgi:hypothetical protein